MSRSIRCLPWRRSSRDEIEVAKPAATYNKACGGCWLHFRLPAGMIDETHPPNKGVSSGRSGARRGPPLPPVDQTSDTLHGFTPVSVSPPPTAPPDETHPKAGDATAAVPPPGDGGTMVPNDAAPALEAPQPGDEPRSEERRVGKECRSRWSA